MTIKKMTISRISACGGALISLALTAGAVHAETSIRFATALPAGSGLMAEVYQPWIDAINEEAEGVFEIVVYPPPFATGANVWERTVQGIADIGLIVMPATGLPFAGTMVTTLPGTGSDVRSASAALWTLYEEGLLAGEYDDVHLMSLTATPPLVFVSNEKVTDVAQLDGMKVRVNDQNGAEALTALGAVPVALPFSEAYQAFSRGVVDGGVANGVTLVDFKFAEVVRYQIRNIEFGFAPSGVVMNKEFYDGLSQEAKDILDRFSGMAGSIDIAMRQYEYDQKNMAILHNRDDYTIVTLSQEDEHRWEETIAGVAEAWAKRTPDGGAILNRYLAAYEEAVEGFK